MEITTVKAPNSAESTTAAASSRGVEMIAVLNNKLPQPVGCANNAECIMDMCIGVPLAMLLDTALLGHEDDATACSARERRMLMPAILVSVWTPPPDAPALSSRQATVRKVLSYPAATAALNVTVPRRPVVGRQLNVQNVTLLGCMCVSPPQSPRLWLQPGDVGDSTPAGAPVSSVGTTRKPVAAGAAHSGEVHTSVTLTVADDADDES